MYDAHSLVTHIHLVLFAKKKKDVEGKNNVFNVSTIQAKTIGITKTCWTDVASAQAHHHRTNCRVRTKIMITFEQKRL